MVLVSNKKKIRGFVARLLTGALFSLGALVVISIASITLGRYELWNPSLRTALALSIAIGWQLENYFFGKKGVQVSAADVVPTPKKDEDTASDLPNIGDGL